MYHVLSNTVYIGFCDQPPSWGSRSLNPIKIAKSSVFSPGILTIDQLVAKAIVGKLDRVQGAIYYIEAAI